MPSDVWLMIMISFGCIFLTSVFWIAYGSYRVDQVRQIHAREVEGLKGEISNVGRMVQPSQ